LSATLNVMVVSGDRVVCDAIGTYVALQGCQPVTIDNAGDALSLFRAERPELVVLDVGGAAGLTALDAFKRIDREIPLIGLSARGNAATVVVQAMKLGAADVLSTPLDGRDFEGPILKGLTQRRARRDLCALRLQVQSQTKYTLLYGTGAAMGELRELIDLVADIDVPVLIQGESGTGKELVARALAATPMRRAKPFVKVNCAALPAELLEAELFGFERGAFTGAIHGKPGKFEVANGGTLFLDEIGEIPPQLQAKLLQVLQDGHFSRLGSNGETHVHVRIVAATNCNLEKATASGQFREDLLFRLNVIPLSIPPLRERLDVIPELTELFSTRWAIQYNRRYRAVSSELMQLFLHYAWPGNIRELENVIKRTVILGSEAPAHKDISDSLKLAAARLATSPRPEPLALPGPLARPALAPVAGDLARGADRHSLKQVSREAGRQAERSMILRMLEQTHGNRKQASRNLGISYKAFLYKAKAYGFGRDA
jgi:two-component system response regulator AtoC